MVVSFVNMKGGVGKTTLSVNFADFLSSRNRKRVLFVDVDPQFNATQCLLNSAEYDKYYHSGETTIIDIFNYTNAARVSLVDGQTKRFARAYDSIIPVHTKRGFDLIPGQLDLFRFEMAPGQGTENRLKNYLNYVKQQNNYDICIIDSPPTPSVWMTSALLASDFYLIPSKPDPISMTGLDLLDSIIRERKENYGCDCKCAGLVLTMVETNTITYRETVEYFSKSAIWKKYLYESCMLKRTEIPRGQLSGRFIIDIDDPELKRLFSNIIQEFLKRVEKNESRI